MKKLLLLLTVVLTSCSHPKQETAKPIEIILANVFQAKPEMFVDLDGKWLRVSNSAERKLNSYAGAVYLVKNLVVGKSYKMHFFYKFDKPIRHVFFTFDPTWDKRTTFCVEKPEDCNKELEMIYDFKATMEEQPIPFILEFQATYWMKDLTVTAL